MGVLFICPFVRVKPQKRHVLHLHYTALVHANVKMKFFVITNEERVQQHWKSAQIFLFTAWGRKLWLNILFTS